MTVEAKWCGNFPCQGKSTGKCAIAEHIFMQSQYLDWTKKAWENFIERTREGVLPVCAHPEKLGHTIATVYPSV